MSLFRSPVLVVDTETTGWVGQEWARVVELGAVLLHVDGTEAGAFGSLVQPDILDHRADPALAVNQIARDALAAAPPKEQVVDAFSFWLSYLGVPRPWVTSFNVAFDRPFLERMGAHGHRWAPCIMLRARAAMKHGAVEMGMARQAEKPRSVHGPSLARAASHFEVPEAGEAHRAVADARRAAGVLCAIRRRELARWPPPSCP